MIPEPFNRGWGVRATTNPFFDLVGAPGPAPVTLPHDAMISRERSADARAGAMNGFFPGGEIEYHRTLEVPADWQERRAALRFQGVYRDARVYVNGALAGHHATGYSQFVVALDPFLAYGAENHIKVECTAEEDARWYSGQGIFRPVDLYVGELLHLGIDTLRATSLDVDDRGAIVQIADTIVNESAVTQRVRVSIDVRDADGALVASDSVPMTVFPGESTKAQRRLYLGEARRWRLDDPHLYTASVTIIDGDRVIDRSESTFGVRTLQLDPTNGLRLNGTPVKLRGACVHHDNGPIGAATIGRAEERRVELLKEAGFNAIRSAHNPMSEAMLAACDRLGVLVMDEAFDTWNLSKARFDSGRDFEKWWATDLAAMVAKDYNHPSVIMYSIGNEIAETGSALDSRWGRRLAATVRSLDSSRYVVNCMNGLMSVVHDLGDLTTGIDGGINDMLASMVDFAARLTASELVSTRTEEAMSQVDVVGYNYGDSRYELDVLRFPHRVSVGSETSRTSLEKNWALIQVSPHVLGDFCWTGWDYLGEVGVGRFDQNDVDEGGAGITGPFPYLTAFAGDLDITGTRRPSSYYRQVVFGLRSDPYIAVHRPSRFDHPNEPTAWSWTDALESWTWAGDEGRPVRVDVYVDADEVDLLVNGRAIGTAVVGTNRKFMASFETTYDPGSIEAVARRDGRVSGRSSIRSALGPRALSLTADHVRIPLTDDSLAFVRASLVDASGALDTSAHARITLDVSGSGELQGFGSGDPRPDEPIVGHTRSTFDGTALAVIRPTGRGAIIVTARADGYDPASLSIEVA